MKCLFTGCPDDATDDGNFCTTHVWGADISAYEEAEDCAIPDDGPIKPLTNDDSHLGEGEE